jgi:peroxiredoxin Q/BCP
MKSCLALLLWLLPAAGFCGSLKVGDTAPDFSLPSSTGKTVTLAEFHGKQTVVLAFYPKAFTGGCTKEMTAYRDMHAQFTGADSQILGISMDDVATQTKFAESLKTPFPLLADEGGAVAKAYGVAGEGYANRVTFVIGKDGKIVQTVEGRDAIDPGSALSACPRPAKP